jgi:hypothetical protein
MFRNKIIDGKIWGIKDAIFRYKNRLCFQESFWK